MKTPPMFLREITLSQFVDFQYKYGDALNAQFKAMQGLPAGSTERATAYMHYNIDNTIQQYAHYTGTPIDEVLEYAERDLAGLCELQGKSFIALKQDEVNLIPQAQHSWNGEVWQVKPIFDKSVANLSHQQFEDSQDIALIYSDISDGRHEAYYELCAAFMRKDGELYSNDLVDRNGPRVELMKSLPMNMFKCVDIYCVNGINLYLQLTKK